MASGEVGVERRGEAVTFAIEPERSKRSAFRAYMFAVLDTTITSRIFVRL